MRIHSPDQSKRYLFYSLPCVADCWWGPGDADLANAGANEDSLRSAGHLPQRRRGSSWRHQNSTLRQVRGPGCPIHEIFSKYKFWLVHSVVEQSPFGCFGSKSLYCVDSGWCKLLAIQIQNKFWFQVKNNIFPPPGFLRRRGKAGRGWGRRLYPCTRHWLRLLFNNKIQTINFQCRPVCRSQNYLGSCNRTGNYFIGIICNHFDNFLYLLPVHFHYNFWFVDFKQRRSRNKGENGYLDHFTRLLVQEGVLDRPDVPEPTEGSGDHRE